MVNEISVTPEECRGLNNILEEKLSGTFMKYQSTVSMVTDSSRPASVKVFEMAQTDLSLSMWLYPVGGDSGSAVKNITVEVGTPIVIGCTIWDHGVRAPSGLTMKFYVDSTLIGTKTTNAYGNNSVEYTPNTVGTFNVTCVFEGDGTYGAATSAVSLLTSTHKETVMSFQASAKGVAPGTTVTWSGVLADSQGNGIANKSILIQGPAAVVTTDSNGAFSKSLTLTGLATYNYYAQFNQDSYYQGVTSDVASVICEYSPESVIFDNDNWNSNVEDQTGISSTTNSLKYMTNEYTSSMDYTMVLAGGINPSGGELYIGLNNGTGDYIAFKIISANVVGLVKVVNGTETVMASGNVTSFNQTFANGITVKRENDKWTINGTVINITGLKNTLGLAKGISLYTDGFDFDY